MKVSSDGFRAKEIVGNALRRAFHACGPDVIEHVVEHTRLLHFAAGSTFAAPSGGGLSVVALGVVAGASIFRVGSVLPPNHRNASYRALREVALAHVSLEGLERVGASALVGAMTAGHTPPSTPLLVGVSGTNLSEAHRFAHDLAAALRSHGTTACQNIAAHGPVLPSRLDLAHELPAVDFQFAIFPTPTAPTDVPSVDRWLYVVDGMRSAEGPAMPRKRSSLYGASIRPAAPEASREGPRFPALRGEPGLAPRTLIVMHDPSVSTPRQTARHLAYHRPTEHRHVRRGCAADYARVARELAGKPVGVALGAGGARGLAHLGVLRAADERGIPVDYLSGTSIGAVMGALFGLGLDAAGRLAEAERLVAARPFREFTWPTTALLRGRRFEVLADELFGTLDIADLWIPLVTMTCDLGEFRDVVHRQGSLREVLLAGCVLPGVLPPRVLDSKIHVDGGTADMLPVNLLRTHCPGPIVAVDVSPWDDLSVPSEGYPAGTDALMARLRGRPAPLSALQTFWRALSYNVAQRAREEGASADVLIAPDVGSVGISDLHSVHDVEAAGYAAAMAAFAREPGLGLPRCKLARQYVVVNESILELDGQENVRT